MNPTERPTGVAAEAAAVFAAADPLIWIITAADGPRRGGLLATFAMQASIVPDRPRLLIGIGKPHHTWRLIHASRRFAAHLVGHDQLDRCWSFALETGFDRDKLDGLPLRAGVLGTPLLEFAAAFLECQVEAEFDTGDRSLFLGAIVAAACDPSQTPIRANAFFAAASPDQRRILGELYQRDGLVDRQHIDDWRRHHLTGDP
ncbi:MAG: hypothetical protein KatS3mg108_1243 [Isosphaeraceae bacterium]|jgi:flavin reductase (DIM6/NTAB) family NADH-FMN oxidoreductase RutF|nr:MAG: hypothetical protein KatS3mg108_1243 [Isosphaeraceae bacterium]